MLSKEARQAPPLRSLTRRFPFDCATGWVGLLTVDVDEYDGGAFMLRFKWHADGTPGPGDTRQFVATRRELRGFLALLDELVGGDAQTSLSADACDLVETKHPLAIRGPVLL